MPRVKLQSIAQTETAGLFSICFDGESYTEFQKFIIEHKDTYSKDLNIILAAINKMLTASGFLERYFRPEGKISDNLCALPLTSGKLRLYCLRMSDSVLIAGNGGIKNVKRYEDSKDLNGYVINLQKLDKALKVAIKKGTVTIEEHNITNIDKEEFVL